MIKNLTNEFLTYSRVTLFILFVMASFDWHNSSDPISNIIITLVNLIGGTSLLSWIFAVGHKANDRLQKQNIALNIFKFFNLGFIVVIVSALLMFLFSHDSVTYEDNSDVLSYRITYSKPGEIAFFFAVSLLFVFLVAAKALVSAEKNKEAELSEYFMTFLLFLCYILGLWWIQPRAKKL